MEIFHERRYYGFLLSKRRSNAFFYFALLCLFRVIMPIKKALLRLLIGFSQHNLILIGFRMSSCGIYKFVDMQLTYVFMLTLNIMMLI